MSEDGFVEIIIKIKYGKVICKFINENSLIFITDDPIMINDLQHEGNICFHLDASEQHSKWKIHTMKFYEKGKTRCGSLVRETIINILASVIDEIPQKVFDQVICKNLYRASKHIDERIDRLKKELKSINFEKSQITKKISKLEKSINKEN